LAGRGRIGAMIGILRLALIAALRRPVAGPN
jgi:hypothetical protein